MIGRMSLILFFQIIILQESNSVNSNASKKFNVILFMAKVLPGEFYIQDAGIKYLNFIQKGKLNYCLDDNKSEDVCKDLLKASFYSLITYSRNMMGMTTAIASVENTTLTNNLRFKRSSDDFEIQYRHPKKRKQSHFITVPEHTEIFKIRAKRQPHLLPTEEPEKHLNTPGLVMGTLQLTFFGKLFESRNKAPQNEQLNTETSLFDLVKDTLYSVQDSSDDGFLIIVLGGLLNEISDPYSNLMQSVKHVVENTNDKNTLVVVTGLCPDIDNLYNGRYEMIPVYVKGPPETSDLTFTEQLYDVPYSLKKFLSDNVISKNIFFPKIKRNKRQVIAENNRNKGVAATSQKLILVFSITITSILNKIRV